MSINSIKNTVVVRGNNTNYTSNTVQVPVSSDNVKLTVTKAYYAPYVPTGGAIYSGDLIVYQIVITNASTSEAATSIDVNDTCETGISFNSYNIDKTTETIITSEKLTPTSLSFRIESLVAQGKVTITIYSHVD